MESNKIDVCYFLADVQKIAIQLNLVSNMVITLFPFFLGHPVSVAGIALVFLVKKHFKDFSKGPTAALM